MRRGVNMLWMLFVSALAGMPLGAQSPEGPIAPRPGVQVQQVPPQAKLVVRVSLVNTPVTVRDANGEMVANLEMKDFRITDNGVEQKISHFDLGGDPISLVVLLETSSRIDPLLPELRKTGILLTQTVMGPTGEAAIVGFNDAVDKLQDFTTNADQIEKTVSRLQTSTSGLKLYDAMAVGVEMLSGRPQASPEQPGHRRVMLILSEATDVGSETRLGEVLRQAQLSNVMIYSVGLSTTRAELQSKPKNTQPQVTPPGTFDLPPQPGVPQTPDTEAERYGSGNLLALAVWAVQHVKDKISDHALEVAATATGGAHLATFKDRSIEKAIDEIGGELHAQYSLSYTPTATNDIGYHEIKVQVIPSGLKVRSRPGYYVAPPES
ncbi:MAG: VWA domain-containing protein [Candidatus Acidiferrales bacterium]